MNQTSLEFFTGDEEKGCRKKHEPKMPLRSEEQSIAATTIPIYIEGVEVARVIVSSKTTRIEFAALVSPSSPSLMRLRRFLERLAAENGSELSCEEDEQGFLKWFDLKPPLKSIDASLFTRRIANAISRALGGEDG